MITDQEAALFSYLAYTPPDKNKVDLPGDWLLQGQYESHDDSVSGFGVKVFRHNVTGEFAVAFRGTDGFVLNDWGQNIELATGVRAVQLELALKVIADIQNTHTTDDPNGVDLSRLTFMGHSLGGGLAAIAAVFFGRPAITFAVAPFEASVRDDLSFPFNPGEFIKYKVNDYYTGYVNYLNTFIGGALPDDGFREYRNAWSNSDATGNALFLSREAAVIDRYVTADPIFQLSAIRYAIAGDRLEFDVGDQDAGLDSPVNRHDMRLNALLMNSDEFRNAHLTHSSLIDQMADESLYGTDSRSDEYTSFSVKLLRATYSADSAARGVLDRFAADLKRVDVVGPYYQEMEQGLIATAIEYYNYAPSATASNLYEITGGTVRFDLRRLPSWNPPGPEGSEIDDGRGGRGTSRLIDGLPGWFGVDETTRMRSEALHAQVWTIKTSIGGLSTNGQSAAELQLGSADASNYLSGAGGDDVLLAGSERDFVDGGTGADAIFGGFGDDVLRGGADSDYIAGGIGNDVLQGGQGEDYLDGYTGNDTYVWSLGDGNDFITDTSGENRLVITGTDATFFGNGFHQISPTQWETVDHGFLLTQGLTWRLIIKQSNEVIDLGASFASGDFGIQLHAELTEAVVRLGDLAPRIENHYYLIQDGNIVPDGPSPGFNDILHGQVGRDALNGLGGNDAIDGRQGDDTILGGSGNDVLFGNAGADAIYGEDGDDALFGATLMGAFIPLRDDDPPYVPPPWFSDVITPGWNWSVVWESSAHTRRIYDNLGGGEPPTDGGNYLDGGNGDDRITGGSSDDALIGGEGHDVLWGMAGRDNLQGGTEDDHLEGDGSNDPNVIQYVPAALQGDDTIAGNAGADVIYGQGGSDFILGDDATEASTDGDDFIHGDDLSGEVPLQYHGKDWISLGGGSDTAFGDGGDDIIYGGSGSDALFGDGPGVTGSFEGADFLFGESGNDNIHGNGGNDVLVGGTGADQLYGEAGDDTYIFTLADSKIVDGMSDVIHESADPENHGNRIVLGEGFLTGELHMQLESSAGMLLIYQGPQGNQSMIAVENALRGVISEVELGGVQSWRKFLNSIAHNVQQAASGDNSILYGGGGNDELRVAGDNVTTAGGHGNDVFIGNAGATKYFYDVGDGRDVIRDPGAQGVGTNRLVFGEGIALADLRLSYVGKIATLSFSTSSTDSIDLGYFDAADVLGGQRTIDEFEFSDGSVATWANLVAQGQIVVDGSDDSTAIIGTSVADLIMGSGANESISAGAGNDTIYFGRFSGNDVIENGAATGADTVRFEDDLTPGYIQTFRNNDDLVIRIYDSGNRLIVRDFFSGSTVTSLRFADGTIWTVAEVGQTPFWNQPSGGGDFLLGTDGADVISGGNGGDSILGDAGGDTINGDNDDDILRGEAGDDILNGGVGRDTLDGGTGNDTLTPGAGGMIQVGGQFVTLGGTAFGGAGNDTLVISGGEGMFTSWVDTEGENVISFGPAVDPANVRIVRSGSGPADISIFFNANERIDMSMESFRNLSELRFSNGTILAGLAIGGLFDVASANVGDGTIFLRADLGDTTLGRQGSDLLIAYTGGIQDWVETQSLDSRWILYSIVPGAELGLSANSVLVVHNWYDAPQGTYLSSIVNFWNGGGQGTPIDLYTTAWNIGLNFEGTAGPDTLIGTDVNDILTGGSGNDTLEGRTGNDTYNFASGFGDDTITDTAGADTILFTGAISSGDIVFHDTEQGLEAIIGNPADGNRIVVNGWFTNPQNRVETWAFAGDQIALTAADVEARITGNRPPSLASPIADTVALAGAAFSHVIPANTFVDPNPGDTLAYSAALVSGQLLPAWMSFDPGTRTLSGTRPEFDTSLYSIRVAVVDGGGRTANDTITVFSRLNQQVGTEQADALTGGSADDVLEGLGGPDVLIGGDGNDELSGGAGHDQLDAGAGTDLVKGGAGEDRIIGGSGNDRLEGGEGADTYLFDSGFGNDTIVDSAGRSRIEFTSASAIGWSNLAFARSGDDMIITNGANSIRVQRWYTYTTSGLTLSPSVEIVTNVAGQRLAYNTAQVEAVLTGQSTAPNFSAELRPMFLTRGQTFSYTIPANFVSEIDPLGLTYSFYSGSTPPAWVSFDPATRTISGTVPLNEPQLGSVSISATNAQGRTSTGSVRYFISDSLQNIDGTSGVDNLAGSSTSPNYIRGFDGDDTLQLNASLSFADGGDGNDLIRVSAGPIVYAGAGNDRIENAAGVTDLGIEYRLYGEGGDDVIAVTGTSSAYGGDGNDIISGSRYAYGEEGDDLITGLNSTNTSSRDQISGGAGNDTINALDGDDTLRGDDGNDVLSGGAGADTIDGGTGDDVYDGGTGNDRFLDTQTIDSNDRYIAFRSNSGTDEISDSGGYDTIEFLPSVNVRIDQLVFTRVSSDLRITMPSSSTFRISVLGWGSVTPTNRGAIEELWLTDQGLRYRYTNQQLDALAAGTNLAPEASQEIVGQTAAVGSPFSMQVATNVFSDAASQFSLQYSATLANGSALPAWLAFDPITRTFSGTPPAGSEGVLNVRLRGQDAGGLSATMDFVIGVGVNAINGSAADDYVGGTAAQEFIYGGSGNDSIQGGAGNDYLFGEAGNDVLEGGAGTDSLSGGLGNDVYYVSDALDSISEQGAGGVDEVRASVTYTLGNNVENLTLSGTANIDGTGNALANILLGNSGANILDGWDGADMMQGGGGNDTYVVDHANDRVVEEVGAGNDAVNAWVNYTLGANVESLILQGSNDLNAIGNAEANILVGNAGINTIDGGAGADQMSGGAGDDTYVVDNIGDQITETADATYDEVLASVSYTLGSQLEGLVLTGTSSINGTGNALANDIWGNSGNNVLDGAAGNDHMEGGAGNDTYVFDSTGDSVLESSGQGTDTIQTTVTLGTLANNVENLTLLGTGNLNATGNTLANVLTGNTGNNAINGGTGADQMIGGLGNDSYTVDNVGDVVTEAIGEGTDTVTASLNNYVLAANVENLTVGGTFVTATGNGLDNTIVGNSAANNLTGGAGNDSIDGGTGTDTMIGGLGDDMYFINVTADVVQEAANEGTDTVTASVTGYTLASQVENLILTGTVAAGTGNTLDNVITGNASNNTLSGGDGHDTLIGLGGVDTLTGGNGNDILDGGAGNDAMTGGAGNDTYVVDSTSDGVTEAAGGGTDTVQTTVQFSTWTAQIENWTLLGSGNINAPTTASGLNNVIIGNSGNNTLDGGAGDDTLNGGAGTDSLIGGTGADIYQYTSGGGADTINNVAADSLNDRLQFTNLASSQVTFAHTGNNLVITVLGGGSITATNWFSATANRIDFLNFTNGEYTANQVDAAANGGGTLNGFAPPSAMLATTEEDFADWTLGGKDSANGRTIWRPIKDFMDARTELGMDRLVGAMASFGAGSLSEAIGPMDRPLDAMDLIAAAAQAETSRRSERLGLFRAALD